MWIALTTKAAAGCLRQMQMGKVRNPVRNKLQTGQAETEIIGVDNWSVCVLKCFGNRSARVLKCCRGSTGFVFERCGRRTGQLPGRECASVRLRTITSKV